MRWGDERIRQPCRGYDHGALAPPDRLLGQDALHQTLPGDVLGKGDALTLRFRRSGPVPRGCVVEGKGYQPPEDAKVPDISPQEEGRAGKTSCLAEIPYGRGYHLRLDNEQAGRDGYAQGGAVGVFPGHRRDA